MNTNFENPTLQILRMHPHNITSIHKTENVKNHKTISLKSHSIKYKKVMCREKTQTTHM